MIGGSPDELRALARRLEAAADGMSACAASGRGAHEWQGQAAEAHAARLADAIAAVFGVGAATREAAVAVDRVADVVEARQQALQDAWEDAKDAAEKVGETVEDFGDFAKDQLARMF